MSYFRYLCLSVYTGSKCHLFSFLFCVFVLSVFFGSYVPILPVFPFLIAPSVFSNVYDT